MLGSLTNRRWHVVFLALLTLVTVLPGLASLPVIDRDEARFAQASVQMADTNDLMNIRFQDEARNKKPAAAYWAQTAMIKVFARDGEPRIWAQRLPSVFAALLTIIALYWGGARMVGRQAAFIACALLATSLIFVFEGHIAKTDALLCASTTLIFASLGRLRHGAGPASLFLLPGLAYAARILRSRSKSRIALSLRLTLCWVVPFWGLIEIMPTKLPHYGLPVFPALCLLRRARDYRRSYAMGP